MSDIIEVRDADGAHVGFTQIKPLDHCRAPGCGTVMADHWWIAADNGKHLACKRRPAPSEAQHHELDDGTAMVTYRWHDGSKRTDTVIYASKREASIESMLRMFPGTSREWLLSIHAQQDSRSRR